MTTEEYTKILSKIKKCLALSKSSEPFEAAAALRQAQKLMAIHNVAEETVELGPLVEEGVRSVATATRIKDWEGRLFHAIKDAFGVGLMFTPNRVSFGTWTFIGPKADVMVAKYTLIYLRRQCQQARERYLSRYRDGQVGRARLTQLGDSYAVGWVHSVTSKIDKLARPSSHQALIKKAVEDITGGRTKKPRSSEKDDMAILAGNRDGQNVSLHRPMDGHAASVQKKLGVIQ